MRNAVPAKGESVPGSQAEHDWTDRSKPRELGACETRIGFHALVDSPYVDNPQTQPVESLCLGQVSAMHSTM